MAGHPTWDTLPSVIIVEILSYLSLTEKFVASSTCTRWRECLFHPLLWRRVDFSFKYGSRQRARFLCDTVGRFVKDAKIEFISEFWGDVRDCLKVLMQLSKVGNLEKFVIKPSSFLVSWPIPELGRNTVEQQSCQELYLEAIDEIIENSRHLRQLSLGCIPELTDHSSSIIYELSRRHYASMEKLHIASVKEDPESYPLLYWPTNAFIGFDRLQELSLDYDYLSNDLLLQFSSPTRKVQLDKLILHVHGMDQEREKITNSTWERVVKANPDLSVSLSLIHSIEGCTFLSEILHPALPLVHFRMLFCQGLNISGIHFISRFMSTRLESVHIVDALDDGMPVSYDILEDEDPFVMLAWKCSRLKHFTLIGYDLGVHDVIAIARLRGPQLETFYIPLCCLSVVEYPDHEGDVLTDENQLAEEVSGSLGRSWYPVLNEDLPSAVTDPMANAESAYLDLLLQDQRI